MLRALLALLLLANLGWWAWHWPPVASALGLVEREREPQRLARQIEPDSIQLVAPDRPLARPAAPPTPAAAASAPDAVAAPGSAAVAAGAACLEAGPLDEAGLAQARRELQQAGASADSWVDIRRELPGSVAIYMGRFADLEQAKRKDEELRAIGVAREFATGALAPGLILGRYTSNAQAEASLQRLQTRGVRTARLMTLVAPSAEHVLRVDRADLALQTRLLNSAAASGAASARLAWRSCKP